MAILNVGADQAFTTVRAAVLAAKDGDTVLVQAGTYLNDFAIITHSITLKSVGGLAVMKATEYPPNGKAIFTTSAANITVDGFGFTGVTVADNNGAGIRHESGNLVVRNSVFWDNQEGILTTSDPNATLTIEGSEFSHNGAGDGYSHNIYAGGIAALTINNSYFHDAVVGHEIKSRARATTITNSRIMDNNGDASYAIDIPDGGVAVIENNVIEKGANAPNYTAIHFGGENGPYAGSSMMLRNNVIVNDNAQGFLLNNAAKVPVTMTGNTLWGFAAGHLFQGYASAVTQSGTTTLTERPTLDLSSMAPEIVVNPPQAVIEVPLNSPYSTFGQAGAVVASGHVLTVGAHAQFQSLAAALLSSKDGDTIQVAAGTYMNDFGVVNHKVIIEGVGGIARFVQSSDYFYGPRGILTVNTDVTLKNLEFSGGHGGANQHQGGLLVLNGDVTVVNSKFMNNDVGIYAWDSATTTVSVFGSEIGFNGNFDKGTHNLAIGKIGSFTLKNSYVHDAPTGHEIWDHAYNTVIDGNRIMDGPDVYASFLIGLGQGGNAIISNNILEKGLHSSNDNLVFVGGEGLPYDNTNVRITGNTLVSNMVWPDHPYTYFLAADQAVTAAGPVTADNNTFIGGVNGSAQAINVQSTNARVGTPITLDRSSPVSAALATTAMAKSPPGLNTLTLGLTEVKRFVDSQFIVSVDGQVVGGGIVTAAQYSTPQIFRFTGWWPTGMHQVTVTGNTLFSDKTEDGSISSTALIINHIDLDGAAVDRTVNLDPWTTSYTTTLAGTTKLPDFDAAYYRAHNPDVAAAGTDPLTHYMQVGWKEGRDPSAWFNTRYYLAANPDVAAANINPLVHYERSGWFEGRDPSLAFNLNVYRAAHPEITAANVDPLQAYMQSGDTRLYSDPLVDAQYYHAHKPSVAATATDAITDYHAVGWKQGLNPSAWFDATYYSFVNRDVAAAGIDPLQHYETHGWIEGRSANPWFSASAYTAAHPETVGTGINPLVSFLQSAAATATPAASPYLTREAAAFDAAYYLARNPDVAAAHVDPLFHYEQWGWHEGRDPSAAFSTNKYVAAYADVKAAHVDPLAHYTSAGVTEGRQAFAV